MSVLETVHVLDGYPSRWPDRPARWLTPDACAAAWVAAEAEQPEQVLGHVCVVRDVDEVAIAALAGVEPGQLAAVSRLFVAPSARARGVGAALLTSASRWAAQRGLRLMLEVVEDGASAVALYERLGWRLVDRRLSRWVSAQGNHLPLRSYLAP